MTAFKITLLTKGDVLSVHVMGKVKGDTLKTTYGGKTKHYLIIDRYCNCYMTIVELNWLGRFLLT